MNDRLTRAALALAGRYGFDFAESWMDQVRRLCRHDMGDDAQMDAMHFALRSVMHRLEAEHAAR